MEVESGPADEITQLTAFKLAMKSMLSISRIREIIRPLPVTPVRRGPRFVEGVISLRGSVIPVVDMSALWIHRWRPTPPNAASSSS